VYLSTSKLAVAAVGNLSFAMALAMYNLVIKVSCCSRPLHKLLTHSCNHAPSQFLWLAGLLLARYKSARVGVQEEGEYSETCTVQQKRQQGHVDYSALVTAAVALLH
jgi:hypothetical protein